MVASVVISLQAGVLETWLDRFLKLELRRKGLRQVAHEASRPIRAPEHDPTVRSDRGGKP